MVQKEKKSCEIGELISQCLRFLETRSFSNDRIARYKDYWNRGILKFMGKRGLTEYTPSIGSQFRMECNHDGTVRPQERDLIRSVTVLDDMLLTGTVSLGNRKTKELPLTGGIGADMERFIGHLESLRRGKSTIRNHRLYLFGFLGWLEDHGASDTCSITERHIVGFVGTYTGPSKTNVICSLRMLFRFWHEEGIHNTDMTDFFKSFPAPARAEKIPSRYSQEEVMLIEASINRTSAVGKRDYAMTLLASRLGFRASDIAGLTFEDIDWDANVISCVMQKTGKPIVQPLLAEVGNAIVAYLGARRENPSRNVFLSACAPYRAVTSQCVRAAIRKAIKESGVDTGDRHHGPHSLRASLASAMLKNGASLNVIKESLGHERATTTMRYLRVDMESLRRCALPVPPVPEEFYRQKGGVFYHE